MGIFAESTKKNEVLSRTWAAGGPVFICAAVALAVAFIPVFVPMYWEMAGDFTSSQNVLFPFVAAVLIASRIRQLRAMPRKRVDAGLVIAVCALLLYAAAMASGKIVTARYCFPIAVTGLALWFWGPRMLKLAWAPIALLFLTVPLHSWFSWSVLRPVARLDRGLIAQAAVAITRAVGIPSRSEGYELVVPGARLNIDIRCTGLNFVIALLVISIVILYLSSGSWKRKLALLPFVPLVGMAANIVRVSANLAVAYKWGADEGFVFFHNFGGVLFALVAVGALVGVARVLGLRFGMKTETRRKEGEKKEDDPRITRIDTN